MPPIIKHSQDPAHDALVGGRFPERCGYGPRIPLLISPFAKPNFVLHRTNDPSSLIRFIEDNWSLGRVGDGSFDAVEGPSLMLSILSIRTTSPAAGRQYQGADRSIGRSRSARLGPRCHTETGATQTAAMRGTVLCGPLVS